MKVCFESHYLIFTDIDTSYFILALLWGGTAITVDANQTQNIFLLS